MLRRKETMHLIIGLVILLIFLSGMNMYFRFFLLRDYDRMARIVMKDGAVTAARQDETTVDGFVGMALLAGDILATHIASFTSVNIDRMNAFMDFDELTTVHVDELFGLDFHATAIFNLIQGKIFSRIYPDENESVYYAIRFLDNTFTANDADFTIEASEEGTATITVLRGEGSLSVTADGRSFSFLVQSGQTVRLDGETITVNAIRHNQVSKYVERMITEEYVEYLTREYVVTGPEPHGQETPWSFSGAPEQFVRVIVVTDEGVPIQGAALNAGTLRGITAADGSFIWMINPGMYTLTVQKSGFESRTQTVDLNADSSTVYVVLSKEVGDT